MYQYLDKNQIKAVTGKSETTIKKFIQQVKSNQLTDPSIDPLTKEVLTRNKQKQILVNELFVRHHFNVDPSNDPLENKIDPFVNPSERPVDPSQNDLLQTLKDEITYLRSKLDKKDDELEQARKDLYEVTKSNQKLLENQQIIQQTSNTKAIEEDTTKRKWWQRKRG